MFLTIVTYAKTYAKIRFAHSQFKKQGLRTSRNRKVCKTLDISFTTLTFNIWARMLDFMFSAFVKGTTLGRPKQLSNNGYHFLQK